MKIGFVGLGHMGTPMAARMLAAGHDLIVCSRNAADVARLRQAGARVAASFAALAEEVEVLCSCRVTPADSIELFASDSGVPGSAARNLLCIDFSTVDPMTSRRIAETLRARGHGFLDAPVSGGPPKATDGTLSIMIGGSDEDFRRAEPVLRLVGAHLHHLGPVGAGVTAKLCNNMITGTLHVLIAEAMVLGAKAGIDSDRLYEVLRTSSARSNTLDRVVPQHFLPRNFAPASALTTMIKDLDCILATGKTLGVQLSLSETAQQRYIEAADLGHGAKDLSAVILPMETAAGVAVGYAGTQPA